MLDRRRLFTNLIYVIFICCIFLAAWESVQHIQNIQNTIYFSYDDLDPNYTYPLKLLNKNDYHSLINLTYFSFNMLNTVCNDSMPPNLIVLVHSSPTNFAKRTVIRDTWAGQDHYYNSDNVKIVFVIGAVKTKKLQHLLELENENHHDIVQGSFLDTYRNLTYKHIMVFKYVIYHCPQAKYILKTDDDVFVNIPTLKNFLTIDMPKQGASKMLFCKVAMDAAVLRSYRSKWRVSFNEYSKRTYPPYCPGWTVLYSPDVVFDLYKASQALHNFFWIDDILVTGFLAEKCGIRHTDIDPLIISRHDLQGVVEGRRVVPLPFLYGRVNTREETIRALWQFVKHHPAPKSVLKVLSGQYFVVNRYWDTNS